MSAPSVEFWDRYVTKIQSFMYSGTSGFLAFLAFRVVFPLLHLGWIRQAILERKSREAFHQLCHKHDKQLAVCAWLLDTLLPCFALFAGVPRRQMNLGLGRENFSVIVNHILFNTDLVHDNYFYLGAFLKGFQLRACLDPPPRTHTPTLTIQSNPQYNPYPRDNKQATSWASTRRSAAPATSSASTSVRPRD